MEVGWLGQTDVANRVRTSAQAGNWLTATTRMTIDLVSIIKHWFCLNGRACDRVFFLRESGTTLSYLDHQLYWLWWATEWPKDCADRTWTTGVDWCVRVYWYNANDLVEHDNSSPHPRHLTTTSEWVRKNTKLLWTVFEDSKLLEVGAFDRNLRHWR